MHTHLKSGIPLGVLIPAPAMITIFLHFSSLIKLAISTIFLVVTLPYDLLFPNCNFLGEVLLGSSLGGFGFGVNERFLNCDVRTFSDWLFLMPFLACRCLFWLDGLEDDVLGNRRNVEFDGEGVTDTLALAFRNDFIIPGKDKIIIITLIII